MRKIIQNIILVAISITPLLGIMEVFKFLSIPISINILQIKIIKDILIVIVLFLSFIRCLEKGFSKQYLPYLLILFFLTLIIFINSSSNFMMAIAGVRWCLPFFLIFLLIDIVDLNLLHKITKILSVLIIAQTMLQIYEMFYMPAYFGVNYFNMSGRLPGFFAGANIAGPFASFVFFMIRYFSSFKKKVKISLLTISSFSVFLAMSSTGVGLLLFLLIFPFLLKSNYKFLALIVIIPIFILTIINLDTITGRGEGGSEASFGTRIEILKEQINESELISSNFGKATNTAINLRNQLRLIQKDAYIADALYTSILSNYGLVFLTGYILLLIVLLFNIFRKNDEALILFLIVIILSGTTLILVEIFPLSLLCAILSAYYLSNKKLKNYRESLKIQKSSLATKTKAEFTCSK